MVRPFLGVTAGIVLALAVIRLVQGLGQGLAPPPAGLDPADPEAFAAAMSGISPGVLLVVLVAYATGTFTGSWLAARIAGGPFYAFLVGGALTLVGASKVMAVPHPLWFTAAVILVFLPSAWLASRLADHD